MNPNLTNDTNIQISVTVENMDAFIESINNIRHHLEEIHKLYYNMPTITTKIVTTKNGEIQK